MKCPFCGQEHPDGTKFCPDTGNLIENQTCKCPHCGAGNLPLDALFCPDCGKSLPTNMQRASSVRQFTGVSCPHCDRPIPQGLQENNHCPYCGKRFKSSDAFGGTLTDYNDEIINQLNNLLN